MPPHLDDDDILLLARFAAPRRGALAVYNIRGFEPRCLGGERHDVLNRYVCHAVSDVGARVGVVKQLITDEKRAKNHATNVKVWFIIYQQVIGHP